MNVNFMGHDTLSKNIVFIEMLALHSVMTMSANIGVCCLFRLLPQISIMCTDIKISHKNEAKQNQAATKWASCTRKDSRMRHFVLVHWEVKTICKNVFKIYI